MKKSFIDKVKINLLAQKKALETKFYYSDIDTDGDETDEIQAKILANVAKQLSNRDREKLVQIDRALAKIEQNEFGLCEDCEEEIAEKRLEINPYFATCISCAEQKEIDRKRRIG